MIPRLATPFSALPTEHMHNNNDTCACDWGPGDGGACWDICNCSCCSLYCCLCWYFCGVCSLSKFYAHSMKQRCAIVNHCLPVLLFPFCFQVITRHNIRKQRGIGDTESCAGWCGDCCIMYWCGMYVFRLRPREVQCFIRLLYLLTPLSPHRNRVIYLTAP